AAVLDALVAGVAASLVMWVALIQPAWTASEGTMAARLVGAAYPVGDVVLLVMLVYLIALGLGRSVSLRLVGLSLGATLVADVLFQVAPYVPGLAERISLVDTGWLIAYLLFGAAALDPSMARVTHPAPARRVQRPGIGK